MIWMIKNWKLVAGGILLLALVSFIWHYGNLRGNVAGLETSLNGERQARTETEASFKVFVTSAFDTMTKVQETEAARAKAFNTYEERLNELQNLFIEHDLGKLAKAKPGLIERRINVGTERVLEDLRRASGFESIADSSSNPDSKSP